VVLSQAAHVLCHELLALRYNNITYELTNISGEGEAVNSESGFELCETATLIEFVNKLKKTPN